MNIEEAKKLMNNCIQDGYIDARDDGSDDHFIALKIVLTELDNKDKQLNYYQEKGETYEKYN